MILAGITVYHPDLERLRENIQAVFPQVEGLVLVVNGLMDDGEESARSLRENLRGMLEDAQEKACHSREKDGKVSSIEERRKKDSSIEAGKVDDACFGQVQEKDPQERGQGREKPPYYIIENSKNEGVAKALNQMFHLAEEKGFDSVLALDQDSVCEPGLVARYKELEGLDKIGMLSPLILDRNYSQVPPHRGEVEEIDTCITSGALCPVPVWQAAGGFYEPLFIDYVDYDFSARVREAGYKIYRVNGARLLHELGRGENHRFFGKRITV